MSKPILCVDFDGEEWRPVDGFPYAVSSFGRVKRLTGGSNNARPGRILKPKTDQDGYQIVRLSVGGAVHDRKVHRLVCEAFNGPPPFDGAEVRHLDGAPRNNAPGNLFWGTALENAADRERHGRQAKGERHHRARLTTEQAREIRRRHEAALTPGRQRAPRGVLPALAREFGLSVHGVATIVGGRGYNV